MKKFLFRITGVILVGVIYLVYTELFYSPLDSLDTKTLFKQNDDLEKICGVDFLGFFPRNINITKLGKFLTCKDIIDLEATCVAEFE